MGIFESLWITFDIKLLPVIVGLDIILATRYFTNLLQLIWKERIIFLKIEMISMKKIHL